MLKASIDLGTNTCLLLIADWDQARCEVNRVVGDYSTIVRLGEGVDKKRELSSRAMDRTIACLRQYAERVREAGVSTGDVICVATSQARDVNNGPQFFQRVEKETGFCFRTLSGDEEARFTFLGGLLPGMDPKRSAVIDIGGGSTELMATQGGKSIDVGCVRFTERFFKSDPVTDEEFWACQEAIDEGLGVLLDWRNALGTGVQLVAVAGTVTTLAQWHLQLSEFNAAKIDQLILTRGDVHRMVEELKWRAVRERCELPGIGPGRADILLAGALILWRVMEMLKFKECRVSTRGLRFGVLGME
jgi:exopolyphosphatase / guanosine-5'-triphosphate,3'-diphosphate pyrophosphatase